MLPLQFTISAKIFAINAILCSKLIFAANQPIIPSNFSEAVGNSILNSISAFEAARAASHEETDHTPSNAFAQILADAQTHRDLLHNSSSDSTRAADTAALDFIQELATILHSSTTGLQNQDQSMHAYVQAVNTLLFQATPFTQELLSPLFSSLVSVASQEPSVIRETAERTTREVHTQIHHNPQITHEARNELLFFIQIILPTNRVDELLDPNYFNDRDARSRETHEGANTPQQDPLNS